MHIAPVNDVEYQDGYIRTFRSHLIPSFTQPELDMLYSWLSDGHVGRIAIYLTDVNYGYKLDPEMVEFIIRELLRGNM